MEFIGYAYDVKELKSILEDLPDYYTIVVQFSGDTNSTPEVYKDESRQDIILKTNKIIKLCRLCPLIEPVEQLSQNEDDYAFMAQSEDI